MTTRSRHDIPIPPTLKLASGWVTRPCDNDSTHKPSAPTGKPSRFGPTPSHALHAQFLKGARQAVTRFHQVHGRVPTDAEFASLAVSLLADSPP